MQAQRIHHSANEVAMMYWNAQKNGKMYEGFVGRIIIAKIDGEEFALAFTGPITASQSAEVSESGGEMRVFGDCIFVPNKEPYFSDFHIMLDASEAEDLQDKLPTFYKKDEAPIFKIATIEFNFRFGNNDLIFGADKCKNCECVEDETDEEDYDDD